MRDEHRRRRIWLVQTGEPLPTDPGPPRLLRTGLLAQELVRRGHDVTFWNASFYHQAKAQRAEVTTAFQIEDGYRAILLRGRPYRRNISFARIWSQTENARSFRRQAPREVAPDVIICGLPTIELADAATAYAGARGIPIAVDCRDMWPEVIEDHVAGAASLAARPLFAYWRRVRARAIRRATAVIGITDRFVEWGLCAARRPRSPLDRAFHLTPPPRSGNAASSAANAYWDAVLGSKQSGVTTGVFAGTLSSRLDIQTIVAAAASLPKEAQPRLKIVLCGKGDLEASIRSQCEGHESLLFAGWRSADELSSLMERADFGILPYPTTRDFAASFPNKLGEFLSFGLPVMTGLEGMTGDMLREHGILLPYLTGDTASARATLTEVAAGRIPVGSMKDSARKAFNDMFDPGVVLGTFGDFVEQLARREQ